MVNGPHQMSLICLHLFVQLMKIALLMLELAPEKKKLFFISCKIILPKTSAF